MAEIAKLASQPLKNVDLQSKVAKLPPDTNATPKATSTPVKNGSRSRTPPEKVDEDPLSDSEAEPIDDEEGEDDDEGHEIRDDISTSDSDSSSDDHAYSTPVSATNLQDCITLRARKFLEAQETSRGNEMRNKASAILNELRSLAKDLEKCYLGGSSGNGVKLFTRLSKYFLRDELESITSAELLSSEIGRVLLELFTNPDGKPENVISRCSLTILLDNLRARARASFLQVFMTHPARGKSKNTTSAATVTPFSVLVHKLQDVLSREEHFEVVTVHHNALDAHRSSAASMISKQLRLKLVADDDSGIPKSFRNMMISVHAIATFKALDDYLRPRISLSDRPKSSKHRDRDSISSAMAALTAAGIPRPNAHSPDQAKAGVGNVVTPPTPASAAPALHTTRKASKIKHNPSTPEGKDRPTGPRRSSRKHAQSSKATEESPKPGREATRSPLECADEKQLSDEDDVDDSSALDAIVDDLEDGMDDEQIPDPTAVNMEIASTGKVTARKEDGTRVATPSQAAASTIPNAPSSRARELLAAGLNPAITGRAMSYAAAIQAVPQDWHIEFSRNDAAFPHETTIFRAVHHSS